MSLTSKIAMKTFAKDQIPAFEGKLQELIGKAIGVQINLESFNEPNANGALFFEWGKAEVTECFNTGCFDRIIHVIGEMCEEPMMKELLAEGLGTIKISNKTDEDQMFGAASYSEGVLDFRANVFSNMTPYEKQVQSVIFRAINEGA